MKWEHKSKNKFHQVG